MSSITLKTASRPTTLSRAKIRKAVSAVYAKPDPEKSNEAVVVKVTKKIASKTTAKAS